MKSLERSTISSSSADAGTTGFLPFAPANPSRRSRAERHFLFSGIVPLASALLLMALGYVYLQLQATDLAYRLSAMREVVDKLETENRELQLEIAAVESPPRLRQLAESLGMGPARRKLEGEGR